MTIRCKSGGLGESVSYRGSHGQTVRVGRSVKYLNESSECLIIHLSVVSPTRPSNLSHLQTWGFPNQQAKKTLEIVAKTGEFIIFFRNSVYITCFHFWVVWLSVFRAVPRPFEASLSPSQKWTTVRWSWSSSQTSLKSGRGYASNRRLLQTSVTWSGKASPECEARFVLAGFTRVGCKCLG